MKNITIIALILSTANVLQAQKMFTALSPGKSMTVAAATTLVNPKPSAQIFGIGEKSSLAGGTPILELIRGFDRTIRVSYQIPARTVLEWNVVRMRAADVLDRDLAELTSDRPNMYESLYSLAYNEFVPLSHYATVNVKLHFRYNQTSPYRTDLFAPKRDSAPINTKTLIIRK